MSPTMSQVRMSTTASSVNASARLGLADRSRIPVNLHGGHSDRVRGHHTRTLGRPARRRHRSKGRVRD